MRACFIHPLILQQLLSTRCLGHTNKRCVSNQLKDNYPHNMALITHRSSSIYFSVRFPRDGIFYQDYRINEVICLCLEKVQLVVIVAGGFCYCCFAPPSTAIHADKNIHVIYGLVCIRTMWCHFLHLVPGVNAIMNRWVDDMIPLLMNFPTEEEDSALPFCTSES